MNPDIEKILLTTILFNPIHEIEQVKHCMTLLCLNSPLVTISKSKGDNTKQKNRIGCVKNLLTIYL